MIISWKFKHSSQHLRTKWVCRPEQNQIDRGYERVCVCAQCVPPCVCNSSFVSCAVGESWHPGEGVCRVPADHHRWERHLSNHNSSHQGNTPSVPVVTVWVELGITYVSPGKHLYIMINIVVSPLLRGLFGADGRINRIDLKNWFDGYIWRFSCHNVKKKLQQDLFILYFPLFSVAFKYISAALLWVRPCETIGIWFNVSVQPLQWVFLWRYKYDKNNGSFGFSFCHH